MLENKSTKQPSNLICGILLVCLFVGLCLNSYKEYKQTKQIPVRLQRLEEKVAEIDRKIDQVIPNEVVRLPAPKKDYTDQVPIVQEIDYICMITGSVCW